jgi:hypothetical protein
VAAAVTRVSGPIDPEAARWAAGLNRPEAGRLALLVPPAAQSAAAVARALLGCLGKRPSDNPRQAAEAESLELARAWLLGHRIDEIVLVHADWLGADAADAASALAAAAGARLVCVVGPAGDAFGPWSGEEIGWVEFVGRVVASQPGRDRRAADPARHQLDPVGPVGRPGADSPVAPARIPEGCALEAYLDLSGRLRRDGRTEKAVARATVLCLRRFAAGELPEAAPGAAAALRQAGWALAAHASLPPGGGPAGPAWGSLRTAVHPHGAAAAGLLAAGLWAREAAAVLAPGAAPDGSCVEIAGRRVEVPAGARPFVAAQRALAAGPGEPLLSRRGRAMRAREVVLAATEALARAGVRVDGRALVEPGTASARWLAARGLALVPAAVSGRPITKAAVCGHGLPREVLVGGAVLSHSNTLCRDRGPADGLPHRVRRAANGFAVAEVERSPLGRRVAVTRNGGEAGELVALEAPLGLLWLQVGVGRAPSLAAIADAVRRDHPRALGL